MKTFDEWINSWRRAIPDKFPTLREAWDACMAEHEAEEKRRHDAMLDLLTTVQNYLESNVAEFRETLFDLRVAFPRWWAATAEKSAFHVNLTAELSSITDRFGGVCRYTFSPSRLEWWKNLEWGATAHCWEEVKDFTEATSSNKLEPIITRLALKASKAAAATAVLFDEGITVAKNQPQISLDNLIAGRP